MDTTTEMAVFVKVVESGGFSSAARDLNMPKSTVSRYVSRLEDRLGVRLLNRTTRSLRPTELGAAYYERVSRIIQEIAEAEAAVTNMQVEPRGTLRVSAPLSFGYPFMGRIFSSFLEAWPEVTLELDLTDRVVDIIDEGFDLAIRIGRLRDSSLIARRLAATDRIVVASPRYLEERGTPKVPDDLRHHDCLLYAYEATTASWRLGPDLTVPVKGRLVSNNGDVLAAAAAEGLGLALLPSFIAGRRVYRGELVRVLQEYTSWEAGVFAVYPHSRHLSTKVRAFVDHLVACFQPEAPWERCNGLDEG